MHRLGILKFCVILLRSLGLSHRVTWCMSWGCMGHPVHVGGAWGNSWLSWGMGVRVTIRIVVFVRMCPRSLRNRLSLTPGVSVTFKILQEEII